MRETEREKQKGGRKGGIRVNDRDRETYKEMERLLMSNVFIFVS